MQIFRQDGTEALNEREPFLRLYEEGEISPTGTIQEYDTGSTWYEYTINIPQDVQGKTFMVFFKSDYDGFFCTSGNNTFTLTSELNTTKKYKIYADYSFDSYNVSTDYGVKIFNSSGDVSYDSRVKEAVYLDHFVYAFSYDSNEFEIFSHESVSETWYSVSTLIIPVVYALARDGQGNPIIMSYRPGLKQTSSGQAEKYYFRIGPTNDVLYGENMEVSLPVILLDPSYL